MAAVELLAALAAEDVTEKTEKLKSLSSSSTPTPTARSPPLLTLSCPTLVGLLSGEAAEPALGVATALARWTRRSNALLEHGAVPVLVQLLTYRANVPPPPAEGEEVAGRRPSPS